MNHSAALVTVVLAVGGFIIGVHDFAYRRFISAEERDFELGGLLSHAATDMTIVVIAIAAMVYVWDRWGPRP